MTTQFIYRTFSLLSNHRVQLGQLQSFSILCYSILSYTHEDSKRIWDTYHIPIFTFGTSKHILQSLS